MSLMTVVSPLSLGGQDVGVYTPQQKLQLDAMSNAAPWQPHYVSAADRARAAQLAHLASQHQLSDYNRLKFGVKGAPFSYVPISLQFPAHVEELRTRQAQSCKRRAWWPSELVQPERTKLPVYPSSPLVTSSFYTSVKAHFNSKSASTPTVYPPLSDTLQQELSLAMSSQLSLHSAAMSAQAQAMLPKTSETHPINISHIIPFELLPLISSQLQKSPTSPALLHLPSPFQLDRLLIAAPLSHLSFTRPIRTDSAPATLTVSLSDNYPPIPYPPKTSSHEKRTRSEPLPLSLPQQPAMLQFDPVELAGALEVDHVASMELPPSPCLSPPSTPPLPTPPSEPTVLLGNMLLSSCPGKKVRLTGPVKGRGAICRDLRSDLMRVRDLGVGCIICCLDDDELDFLGASWSEYSRIANSIGLDVLRLPTPEGLAPLQPSELDTHLTRAIAQYTLRGIPLLVHCRGGVGRAGLVACCWMLKLGLLGSVLDQPNDRVVALAERAITVIRRRRSVKAIETFEQVRFVVEFVEYLREQAMESAHS